MICIKTFDSCKNSQTYRTCTKEGCKCLNVQLNWQRYVSASLICALHSNIVQNSSVLSFLDLEASVDQDGNMRDSDMEDDDSDSKGTIATFGGELIGSP
jgi:hypothetical protein